MTGNNMQEGSALSLALKSVREAEQTIQEKGVLHGNPNSDMARRYFGTGAKAPKLTSSFIDEPVTLHSQFPVPMMTSSTTTGTVEEKKVR